MTTAIARWLSGGLLLLTVAALTVSAWFGVATVMPQAPAASWAANRVGAMLVLPCGAKSTSWVAQYCAIWAMFVSIADRRATMTGHVKGPSNRP